MAGIKSIEEIRRIGYQALVQALGPVDAVRYIRSNETGSGNYTEERKELLSNDLPKVVSDILRARQE